MLDVNGCLLVGLGVVIVLNEVDDVGHGEHACESIGDGRTETNELDPGRAGKGEVEREGDWTNRRKWTCPSSIAGLILHLGDRKT